MTRGPAPGEPRLRLFVACEIPESWKQALAAEARALEMAAPGFGRWVDPTLMHLTLVFLGGQEPAVVPMIQDAIDSAAARAHPFTLSLDQAGTFGGPRSVRVVWVGVRDSPSGSLATLQRALVESLKAAAIPFDVDSGPFRAHLTLGRARRDAMPALSQAISSAIARRQSGRRDPWPPGFSSEEIVLVKSDLRPSGPIYTPIYRASLGG